MVLTGVSGSGKSTLAFDTIFAEGQRRYMESLSSYARQFATNGPNNLVYKIYGAKIKIMDAFFMGYEGAANIKHSDEPKISRHWLNFSFLSIIF